MNTPEPTLRPWWAPKPLTEMTPLAIIEALAFELAIPTCGLAAGLILLARHYRFSPWWIIWPAFLVVPLLDVRAGWLRRHGRLDQEKP